LAGADRGSLFFWKFLGQQEENPGGFYPALTSRVNTETIGIFFGGTTMMKHEFEKRIGLVITSEEYEVIEAAYMGLPESVDKDTFVKIWLKEGGIQGLFDRRLLEARRQKKYAETVLKENNEAWERANAYTTEIQDLKKQIEILKDKLAAIGAAALDAAGSAGRISAAA
jgi:hypothetical protein